MRLADDARISERDDIAVREVNGEAVLLHLVSERYYVLDRPTTRMWHVLVDCPTFGDAIAVLGDEFDVESDVLRRDLERFVGELVDADLASVDPGR